MSALVDGVEWQANFQVALAVGDYYPDEHRMEVNGLQVDTDGATRQISVKIDDFTGPGTYAIGTSPDSPAWAYYASAQSASDPGFLFATDSSFASDEITISVDPDRSWIAGTFRFHATRTAYGTAGDAQALAADSTVAVTEGSFAGKYVTY